MGSGFNSRIFTNSFAGKEREMALPLVPKLYFGFRTKSQYSYNVYRQLSNNGAGFGARGARWERIHGVAPISFTPP